MDYKNERKPHEYKTISVNQKRSNGSVFLYAKNIKEMKTWEDL